MTTVHAAAWRISQAISPRETVRVATVDAYGQVLNAYTSEHPLAAGEPDRPWAVNLTDAAGGYRLLAFDLDAKTPATADAAARDAETIAALLEDHGLPSVVCASGPTGGRHVWTALADSAHPDVVRILAEQTRRLCPTLDVAPLTNPATGCVRPPGAPHRSGGYSTVLSGDLAALTSPTGTAEQVLALAERVIQLVGPAEPASVRLDEPVPLDDDAHPYLPGSKRPLPATAAAALAEDAASGDASNVLWRVLIGAAHARWRYADVAAIADTASGLEHARTERDRGQRRPRAPRDAARLLARQWAKAVAYVASTARQHGDDPTYDRRAGDVAATAAAIQTRADAMQGRWTTRSGPTDRRVLDVLTLLALQAVNASVEADNRRVALLAGVGRETARTALLRLSEEGWIELAHPSQGCRAAHWHLIHSPVEVDRSQAVPRPAGAGAAHRDALLNTLTRRLDLARHDLFTHGQGGLGHHAGNTYARMTDEPQSTHALAQQVGDSPSSTAHTLTRLTSAGVITATGDQWRRPTRDRRDRAAKRLGIDGRLAEREARYASERALWAWWLAELAWMTAPGRHARRTRPRADLAQPALALGHVWDLHPPMPREHGTRGRVIWSDARAILAGTQPTRRPTPTAAAERAAQDRAVALIQTVLGGELVA